MAEKVWQITTKALWLGQVVMNRYHFHDSAGTVPATDICVAMRDGPLTELLPIQDNTHENTSILYEQIFPTVEAQHEYVVDFPLVGAGVSGSVETFVAPSIKWTFENTVSLGTGLPAGHVRRGGKRLTGLNKGATDDNALVGGDTMTAINAYIGALLAPIGGTCVFVVCRFAPRPPKAPGDPIRPMVPPIGYTIVTGGVINPLLGSQVSRKAGHGR